MANNHENFVSICIIFLTFLCIFVLYRDKSNSNSFYNIFILKDFCHIQIHVYNNICTLNTHSIHSRCCSWNVRKYILCKALRIYCNPEKSIRSPSYNHPNLRSTWSVLWIFDTIIIKWALWPTPWSSSYRPWLNITWNSNK